MDLEAVELCVSVVQTSFTSGVWTGSKSHRIIYLCMAGVNMKAILNIWEPKKKVLDLKMVKAKAGRGMRIMQIGLFIPKLDLASISFPLLPSDILQVFPGSPSAFLTSKFSLFTPAFTALPVSCDRGLIAMDVVPPEQTRS